MISNQTVEPSGSTFSSGTQRPGNGVAAAVRRHPLGAFLALSCLLSWWPAALYAGGWSPAPMFGCGPFLAALIVIGLTEGKPGVAALWRSMRTIRGATRFHLVAIAAPIVVTVAALGAAITIGATPDHADCATNARPRSQVCTLTRQRGSTTLPPCLSAG